MTEQSLTEALSILGITTAPSKIEGKRDWTSPTGEFIGSFDAEEGWAKIKYVTLKVAAAEAEAAP